MLPTGNKNCLYISIAIINTQDFIEIYLWRESCSHLRNILRAYQ